MYKKHLISVYTVQQYTINRSSELAEVRVKHNKYLYYRYLTLSPQIRIKVPYANSLDPDETPSNSTSHVQIQAV